MPEGEQVITPGSAPAAVSAPTVTIALEDYHRFRNSEREFGDFKAAQATEMAKKEQARLDALAESGQHKKALEETRSSYETKLGEWGTKYNSLEQSVFAKERDTVIVGALAGREFNAKTPEHKSAILSQIHASLADQFETSRSADGQFQVRHKVTGRPAAEVLKEALASDLYSHYFAADNRGGAGTDATRSPGNPAQNAQKGIDALEQSYFARNQQFASTGLGGLIAARRGG